MLIDRTGVQTSIHRPTDQPGLLGDGVRVLARLLIQASLDIVRDAFRSRLGTSRRLLQQIHRVRRFKGAGAEERQRALYQRLLEATRQTVQQARRGRTALQTLQPPQAAQAQEPPSEVRRLAARLAAQFDHFLPLVEQTIHQAQRRVLDGQPVPSREKVLSLFGPHTRVVHLGKAEATVEFGRQVVFDEVEGGIVTRFHVLSDSESECHQALPAIGHHRTIVGRPPSLVTGDRRLHAKGLEEAARRLGVRHLALPWTGRLGAARQAVEQDRAWRRRYRWRAGIEGRIHSLRRDYGLRRCRSHGEGGLQRDVGWGLLANNLRRIATAGVARAVRLEADHGRAA